MYENCIGAWEELYCWSKETLWKQRWNYANSVKHVVGNYAC